MASDTSLIFRFIPVGDAAVRKAMRQTSQEAARLYVANKQLVDQKAGKTIATDLEKMANLDKSIRPLTQETNAFAASLMKARNEAKNGSWLAVLIGYFKSASAAMEKTNAQTNSFAATSKGVQRAVTGNGARIGAGGAGGGTGLFKIDDQVGNTSRRFASYMILIGAAILAVLGHAVAFVQAVWQIIGVLALVPAVSVAAAVGLGSLLLIFKGLPAALQKSGSAGANAADQLEQATHRYEQAQRSATQAQQDLNAARESAAQALADMDRELKKATLDERSGVLAVKEARERLNQVQAQGGSRNDIEAARIAYEQAVLNLQDIRERNADLQKQEADRASKGVEGSDEVQQALQRQADAMYELQQAQKALTQSQTGGSDAAAIAYAKLSDAGKAVVDALHQIGSGWSDVQKRIQQAGLAGVADEIKAVSDGLHTQDDNLVKIASGWNKVFLNVSGYLHSPAALKIINTTLANTAVMGDKLAGAFVPFIDGFLQFVNVGAPYLPKFGDWVQRIADQFDRWATRAADSGKINKWIDDGVKVAHQFWIWITKISDGIGDIFKAGSGGPDYMTKLADAAERWANFMGSPEGQKQLQDFFKALRDVGSAAWIIITAITEAFVKQPDVIKEVAGALNIIAVVLKFAADHAALLNTVLPPLITAFIIWKTLTLGMRVATLLWAAAQWVLNGALLANPIGLIVLAIAALIAIIILVVQHHEWLGHKIHETWDDIWGFLKGIGSNIASFAEGLWEPLWNTFKAAINRIIKIWNDFHLTLGGGTVLGVHIPSVTLDTPDIPYMATGGQIMREGLFYGHAGENVVPAAQVKRGGAGGGGTTTLVVQSGGSKMDDLIAEIIRRYVRVQGGGNVQTAFGTTGR